MREIKFRAWDRNTKTMNYFGLWSMLIDAIEKGDSFWKQQYEVSRKIGALRNLELMQYTGLKDKNGKEIYEGDIVKSDYSLSTIRHTSDNPNLRGAMPGFYTELIRTYKKPGVDDIALIHREVIGNIYENPKLLKGKK